MKNGFRNWSDVRVFLSVVREGSTLAASRKLGIAQPTVARRIEALENETGLTLFERDTRGFKPTADARSLYPLAEAIENATDDFADKTRELTKRRPIRITAPGMFSDRATDILSEFSALNPGVAFEFLPSLKVLNLLKGEADIAIRIARSEPDENLICRKISTARWALFGGQSYAEKFGLPISPDDLQGHRFVTFKHDDVPADLHNWIARRVSPDQIVMSFSEPELMQASIRAGHGLGLVNLRIASFDDALIRCFDHIEELSRSNMMLIAPEAYRRPEVKAFTKFFAPRYAAIFK
ncbi:MAG: LysR family transcriptional regulator [Boseongicola sp.]